MMTRWMPAAKDGFQVGQTAKARLGPPCAVTPQRTWPPASCQRQNRAGSCLPESVKVCSGRMSIA
jgi:hypothetical protein